MRMLRKGSNNTKRLAYTAQVRPILEYGVVCLDPYREGQVSALSTYIFCVLFRYLTLLFCSYFVVLCYFDVL
jgi:hypothetical protein